MVAAMVAPCSVKAIGRYFKLCPRPLFKVAICDIKWLVSPIAYGSLMTNFTLNLMHDSASGTPSSVPAL